MRQTMIQFRFPGGTPTAAQAAQALGLASEDLDPEFGVIPTDPKQDLYAVRVAASAASRATLPEGGEAEGIFSDPKIAPFGPPEP
jgi:hypothetical protein